MLAIGSVERSGGPAFRIDDGEKTICGKRRCEKRKISNIGEDSRLATSTGGLKTKIEIF